MAAGAPPEREKNLGVIYRGKGWRVGVFNFGVLACLCVLRATRLERSSTFFRKKSAPRENPGYAYAVKRVMNEMVAMHMFEGAFVVLLSIFESASFSNRTQQHFAACHE